MMHLGKENVRNFALAAMAAALITMCATGASAQSKVVTPLAPSSDPMVQACEQQITTEVKAADADAVALVPLSRSVGDRKEGKTEQEVRGHAQVDTKEKSFRSISFRCLYDNGKVTSTKWVFDGTSAKSKAGIKLPATTTTTPVTTTKPARVAATTNLSIASGRYGAGLGLKDVTATLRSAINGGRLAMRVSNDTLGGDPAPGKHKSLTVTYLSAGKLHTVTVAEGGELNIP